MAKQVQHKVTTRRLGSQQQNRLLPALDPSNLPIDGKSRAQNLEFTYRLAALIKLYDTNGALFGNWQWMLQNDATFTLATVDVTILEGMPQIAAKTFRAYQNSADLNVKSEALARLFLLTDQLASNLADWVARILLIPNDKLQLENTVFELIRTDIATLLPRWQPCLHGLSILLPVSPSVQMNRNFYGDVAVIMSIFKEIPDLLPSGFDLETQSEAVFDELDSYFEYLRAFYKQLYRCNVQIKKAIVPLLNASMEVPNHEPHNSLLITLERLLEPAISDLNTLSQRHLDYYYRDVLQLKYLAPIPDQVHLHFELKKDANSALISAGAAFLAGKGAMGEDIVYVSEKELFVNKIAVSKILTVTNSGANAKVQGEGQLFSNAQANQENPWRAFGATNAKGCEPAQIGLVIANPVLALSMGKRKITLVIQIAAQSMEILANRLETIGANQSFETCFQTLLGDAFNLSYTGPKDWEEFSNVSQLKLISETNPPPSEFNLDTNSQGFWLEMEIDSKSPAFVAYDAKVHGQGFNQGAPLLRLLLNQNESNALPEQAVSIFPYNLLRDIQFTEIDFLVSVEGFSDLALQNDYSAINPKKPFQILGPAPEKGDSFFIGSSEVFRKEIVDLSLKLDWTKLPITPNGFADYYSVWNEVLDSVDIHNDSFRVAFSILQAGTWLPLNPKGNELLDFPMYSWTKSNQGANGGSKSKTFSAQTWLTNNLAPDDDWILSILGNENPDDGVLDSETQFQQFDLSGITADIAEVPATNLDSSFSFGANSQSGILRMSLSAPDFGFGASLFQAASYEVNALNVTTMVEAAHDPTITPHLLASPALPFVPIAKAISIDYCAKAKMQVSDAIQDQLYWLQPFGLTEIQSASSSFKPQFTLLPNYDCEGYLFLGLSGVIAPQNLTILVEVDENSASTSNLSKPKIVWKYLLNGQWIAFKSTEVLSDGTKNFSQSGIVSFVLNIGPSEDQGWFNQIQSENDLLWISASIAKDSDATCTVRLLDTQALLATYVVGPSANTHLAAPLAAGTIKKFQVPNPSIAKVVQAYNSFGGRAGESDSEYYTRIHERLRHKNRGLNQWDIERILLEKFPEIAVANCFNHSNSVSDVFPGSALLIAFPKSQNTKQANPYEPKFPLSKLMAFKSSFQNLLPNELKLEVINPVFEQLCIQASLRFLEGLDPGHYLVVLNNDLCEFIAPWTKPDSDANPFGTLLSRALIQGFIHGLPYVMGLENLEVYQSWTQGGKSFIQSAKGDYDYFEPHSPWGIITTVQQHILLDADSPANGSSLGLPILFGDDNYGFGIGDLAIGRDPFQKIPDGESEYLIIDLKS